MAKQPRTNQLLRTRRELLHAARRLLKEGRKPSMEEIAEEAMVSRATAYRHFPNLERLLTEAPLDGEMPQAADLFDGDAPRDPAERVDRAEAALHAMCHRNEVALRLMLAQALSQSLEQGQGVPVRQNRRLPLIEAALEPVRSRLGKAAHDRLCASLALIFGPESMIVFRDVVPLSERKARQVKRWAIQALVSTALKEADEKG